MPRASSRLGSTSSPWSTSLRPSPCRSSVRWLRRVPARLRRSGSAWRSLGTWFQRSESSWSSLPVWLLGGRSLLRCLGTAGLRDRLGLRSHRHLSRMVSWWPNTVRRACNTSLPKGGTTSRPMLKNPVTRPPQDRVPGYSHLQRQQLSLVPNGDPFASDSSVTTISDRAFGPWPTRTVSTGPTRSSKTPTPIPEPTPPARPPAAHPAAVGPSAPAQPPEPPPPQLEDQPPPRCHRRPSNRASLIFSSPAPLSPRERGWG